jgi:hypothetical protein
MPLQLLELPVKPALADVPMMLPVNVLLVLPESNRTSAISRVFNLPGAINEILGGPGWDEAVKIMNARIFAPGWNMEQIAERFSASFGRKGRGLSFEQLAQLRVDEDSLEGPGGARRPPLPYAIRHFTGNYVGDVRPSKNYPLLNLYRMSRLARMLERLGVTNRPLVSLYGRYVYARIAVGETRLLIVQTDKELRPTATQFARRIVAQGGPAMLIVDADNQVSVDEYFRNLYAGIVHNRPLSSAARSEDDRVSAHLVYGEGGDRLLSFDPWRQQLFVRLERVDQRHVDIRSRLGDLREGRAMIKDYEQYLHRAQMPNLERGINVHVNRGLREAQSIEDSLRGLKRDLDFSRESGGVYPLLNIAETVPQVEGHIEELYSNVEQAVRQELDKAVESAPRVINANFAEPETKRILGEREGLLAGRAYHFLVDVGPQWDRTTSIVRGRKEFPEEALPADKNGFIVKVVFISEDFTPHMSFAWMWVPHGAGRSFPYYLVFDSKKRKIRSEKRAETAGPVALSVTAPRIAEASEGGRTTASARLCLYYEGNLLQSAVVKVGILNSSTGVVLEEPNEVSIDFALSNSLQRVEAKYERRAVWFNDQKKESGGHPVRLNLTLNDDGAGGHRIIIIGRPEDKLPPAAWTQYKPQAASALLSAARSELLSCFYLRDSNGVKLNEERKGKQFNNFDQFRFDLRELAKIGSKLFNMVVGQVNVEENGRTAVAAVDWTRQLAYALNKPSLIQVARTVPAEYVLPWALIYDIPMDGSVYPFCRIVEEEWGNPTGLRTSRELRSVCPYAEEPLHAENIICPYGFWGLKHIVEQPPSQLARRNGRWEFIDAVNQFAEQSDIQLAIAVTRDTELVSRVDKHIAELKGIKRLRFTPPSPADDLDTARKAFELPNVVYFLCHGEMEEIEGSKQPFLGIGPRDGKADHRIFPDTIQSWARTKLQPNLAGWSTQRPLVFVNGCQTFALSPDQMLSFVSGFSYARASGVIGTEVSVKIGAATEIALILFEKLCKGTEMGVAIREMRWELANKGSLIGLAYTLYGMADLHASVPS